jgi:hypothetical protein
MVFCLLPSLFWLLKVDNRDKVDNEQKIKGDNKCWIKLERNAKW